MLPQLSQGKLTWKNSIGNVHFICNSGKQFYLQPDCNNKKSIWCLMMFWKCKYYERCGVCVVGFRWSIYLSILGSRLYFLSFTGALRMVSERESVARWWHVRGCPWITEYDFGYFWPLSSCVKICCTLWCNNTEKGKVNISWHNTCTVPGYVTLCDTKL